MEAKAGVSTEELVEPLPKEVKVKVDELLAPGERVRVVASTDLKVDATYGDSWLLATDRRVLVLSNGRPKEVPKVELELPLDGIVGARTEDFVGNGVLEIKVDGRVIEAVRYSKTLADKFAQVALGINKLVEKEGAAKEETAAVEEKVKALKEEKAERRCVKCGRVLPPHGGVCPVCMKKGKLFRRLLGYVKPHWRLASSGLVLAITLTAVGLVPPYLTAILIDEVFPKKDLRLLGLIVLGIVGVQALSAGLSSARMYVMELLGQRIMFDLRTHIYQCLQKLSLSFYDKKRTGGIMYRVTNDTANLQGFLTSGIQGVLINVLTLAGIGIIMFSMNWRLAALTLLPTPVVVIGTILFSKKAHRFYHRVWRRWSSMSAMLGDTIPGIRVVKAFTQEDREADRFTRKNEQLLVAGMDAAKLWTTFFPAMGFITAIGAPIIWGYGGYQVIVGGGVKAGILIAFISYMWRFYSPIQELSTMNDMVQRAATAAERVFEVMDTDPETYASDGIVLPRIEGRIKFGDVGFSYDSGKPILADINLEIESGEMIGVVGASGVGKTTLANLIPRFYDVTKGALTIDGHNVKELNLTALRAQIGVVQQDPFLFHATIWENIAYGKPEATKEEIIAAAKVANAHQFIMNFPDGYDTEVGERGVRLSGGERQRISIARAILHNPRILILDEATSSVDTETERQIQEAIECMVEGRTTIAIAHRLSTLRRANRIIVLDEGRIAEMGTHKELLEVKGIYYRLCKLQSKLAKSRAV